MKKYLLFFLFLLSTAIPLLAQEDEDDGSETIREKMTEYVQQKLSLSDGEARQFKPAFLRYFKEWRSTIRENKGDKIVLQQKIGDLQLRYRNQFRDIIGDQKANMVFTHQRNFIRELRAMRDQRQGQRPVHRNGG